MRKSVFPSEEISDNFKIMYEDPQINIYKFLGSMRIDDGETFVEPLLDSWEGKKVTL